ncbi:MAG: hypothetical protein P4L38_13140 [Syntrophaceae bacterium]|nr:hypothetical protein [Syntrophaceae bacterium]
MSGCGILVGYHKTTYLVIRGRIAGPYAFSNFLICGPMTALQEINYSAISGDDMSDGGQAGSKPIERSTFLQSSFGFTLIVDAA